jgi:hypothetical protein
MHVYLYTMMPKAHGGPPGWLKESDPAGVILYVMDGPYRLSFPYCTVLPLQELSSCELMEFPAAVIYSKCTLIHELRHARKVWPGTLVDPCLLFDVQSRE